MYADGRGRKNYKNIIETFSFDCVCYVIDYVKGSFFNSKLSRIRLLWNFFSLSFSLFDTYGGIRENGFLVQFYNRPTILKLSSANNVCFFRIC